jgi:two-component system nitrate/nitrite response regulator NarL
MTTASHFSLLVVDDEPDLRTLYELTLLREGYDLDTAGTVQEALLHLKDRTYSAVISDMRLPDGSGLDVLKQLRDTKKGPAIVLLTAGMDDGQLLIADKLEPDGIVLKTSDPAHLLECMEQVRGGQRWIDPEIAERTRDAKERALLAPSLTPRERQLVELVRQGLRNRDIAAQLGVTEGTVKVYLHAIFDKVGVDNRTELAMRAGELLGT